ncbi:hypothetical protein QTI66_16045 [Variovorax sp. J22R133]|uniref:hypothetical protein n=1 Tax=Variovorax brevis TaxID=3053503 RepID=UPI0025785F1D|nr:hypothetical protein [Variovorax sp. J22R133]MDM0113671.1 hypothetical protein [Variovorax sp. J22R133]
MTTPGNNRVVVSDAGKSVSLHDQNDNKVELNANGITLSSSTDISLVAVGQTVVKGAMVMIN